MNDDERKRLFCNACRRPTWHKFRWTERKELELVQAPGYTEDETWTIWECSGCESLVAEVELDAPYLTEPEITYYPGRTLELAERKRYRHIPKRLGAIYDEIIEAFNRRSWTLCAAGLRALLEAVCVSIDPKAAGPRMSFPQKLASLESVVPGKIVANLSNFQFLGNQALHELKAPNPADLALSIEVLEDVMNVVFELDYKSANLSSIIAKSTGQSTE
ncbi:MAG TPA: DUF4145 domain-containing protein [Dehalococcoidia bacterium]|nr:DUF4145 domain-containing protein [Dehalococcoidia bacterium]